MNKFIAIATFLLLGLTSLHAQAEEIAEVENISGETVQKMVNDGANLVVIDARRVKDYNKSHLAGAISLPVDETNKESLAKVVPNQMTKIIFYCQNPKCIASHISAKKAIEAGYPYVYVYSGGIEDWESHGFPIENVASKPVDAPLKPEPAAE